MAHLPIPSCVCRLAIWAILITATASAQEKRQAGGDQPCDGDVWCGLFVAKSDAAAAGIDARLQATVEQLGKAFPDLSHFELVGENTGSVFKEYECWIVPSKQLFLKLDSLGLHEDKTGVHLHLQLWQEKHVILKTDAILRRDPVFIAGPNWGDGRLILVLKLGKDGAP